MTTPTETPEQWAERVLKEHGPPPQRVVDHVNRLRRKYAPQSEPTNGKRTA